LGLGLYALFNPGITQYLYLVPLLLYFRRRGERGRVRGVLIAMGLTILLNGLCWVAIETGKFRIGG
jgi:apolipoprotein N-acyltransferase